MKAERETQMAEIFIKTMKKNRESPKAERGNGSKPGKVPPIGEAVAWLRREKEVFKRCLELVKAHPVLIYDDSMDCLWEFLEPLLKKCASDQGKRHTPRRAFLDEHASPSELNDSCSRLKNEVDTFPQARALPSPNKMCAATTPTKIPVRSPKSPNRSDNVFTSTTFEVQPENATKPRPILPPIGMRMGRRRSSSTSELAKLGKITEGESFPPVMGSIASTPGTSQGKSPKTASAMDLRDLDPEEFIKTTYVLYRDEEEPRIVHFPEQDIRRDSIFKYLDSDSDFSVPLDATFSELDRRPSTSSEFSYGF